MRASVDAVIVCGAVVSAITLSSGEMRAQDLSAGALVASLRQGGHVLVMRHASSPGKPPEGRSANADNVKLERQLDDTGRATSAAMGKALRDLKIPVGEVLSSPTYRALETARHAQLPAPQVHDELGDGGQSMKGVSEAQGSWLRERATQPPKGTNTIIVTHMPNIRSAFPDWGALADGESVIVGRDGKGELRALGRIKIEDWPRLR